MASPFLHFLYLNLIVAGSTVLSFLFNHSLLSWIDLMERNYKLINLDYAKVDRLVLTRDGEDNGLGIVTNINIS